jgi:hypothetical protein
MALITIEFSVGTQMSKSQKLDSVLAILVLDGSLVARPGLRLEEFLEAEVRNCYLGGERYGKVGGEAGIRVKGGFERRRCEAGTWVWSGLGTKGTRLRYESE